MRTILGTNTGQIIVLGLIGVGWLFALIEYLHYHEAAAAPFADAGWGALLALFQVDYGIRPTTTPPATTP